MITFLSKQSCKVDDAQDRAMLEGPLIILNPNVLTVALFHKGKDPIGAHIHLLVTWNIFLQFFPILPARPDRYPPCAERHGPQTVSCEVHVALFGQPDLAPRNGLTVP